MAGRREERRIRGKAVSRREKGYRFCEREEKVSLSAFYPSLALPNETKRGEGTLVRNKKNISSFHTYYLGRSIGECLFRISEGHFGRGNALSHSVAGRAASIMKVLEWSSKM